MLVRWISGVVESWCLLDQVANCAEHIVLHSKLATGLVNSAQMSINFEVSLESRDGAQHDFLYLLLLWKSGNQNSASRSRRLISPLFRVPDGRIPDDRSDSPLILHGRGELRGQDDQYHDGSGSAVWFSLVGSPLTCFREAV